MAHDHRWPQVWRLLATVLVVAGWLRLLAALVAGVITATGSEVDVLAAREHVGDVMSAFGSSGDVAGALLVAAAVVLAATVAASAPALLAAARALVAVTTVSIVVRTIGTVLVLNDFPGGRSSSEIASAAGSGIAGVVICIGAAAAVRRVTGIVADELPATATDPVLFAVDRVDGEVFAFFSRAEAVRTLSVYSIEDGEFAFYDDDGTIVSATVADDRVQFVRTDDDGRADLLRHLRQVAAKERLPIPAESAGEPLAYATPIADWQWLQLWPGWLRPIGRLVRVLTSQERRSKSIAE